MEADRIVYDGDTCQAADAVPAEGLHGVDGNLVTPYPGTPPPPPNRGAGR
jgi:hypothetical protein